MNLKENIADYLKINDLRDNIVKLIEAKFELTKLDIQDRIEGIAVKAIYALIAFVLAIVVVIFMSILLALFLNNLLGSQYWGFLIMSVIYLIVLLGWILGKKSVEKVIKISVEKVVDEINLKKETLK